MLKDSLIGRVFPSWDGSSKDPEIKENTELSKLLGDLQKGDKPPPREKYGKFYGDSRIPRGMQFREYYDQVADEEVGRPSKPKSLADVVRNNRYRKRSRNVNTIFKD